ncbi:MAG: hypothetical protein ACD_62C00587G0003 [uncultured bacterium]|nr:MAG: hypothetical protein ACD_62C00587G0003 [uncultured bacterium]HLD45901.1 hypothetical protein [bacterium]
MSSWRDRLCGSEAINTSTDASEMSLKQYLAPQGNVSCGGGYYPINLNAANMKTFKGTFVLPTEEYAILLFKDDGSAVIYSDTEPKHARDDVLDEEGCTDPS